MDLLAFDTIPAVKEAEAIITVLREFPNVKAWVSFSCKVKYVFIEWAKIRVLLMCRHANGKWHSLNMTH